MGLNPQNFIDINRQDYKCLLRVTPRKPYNVDFWRLDAELLLLLEVQLTGFKVCFCPLHRNNHRIIESSELERNQNDN